MSDTTVTAVETTIALDPATSKPPVSAPAKVDKGETEGEPAWVGARLERERAKLLKDLGAESLDAAKAAIAANKAKEDSEKSAAQKAAELETSFKSVKAEKEALAQALSTFAEAQMSALTEPQRAAVAAVAGDDAALQLKTIKALMPTWAGAAAPAAQAEVTKVANTAPGRTAPKDGGGDNSPPDNKAVHADMRGSNPIAAARFAVENRIFDETK